MRYLLCLFLALTTFSTDLFSETPHLVLYFDINKTLIASDKAGNKSVEDVLNELLAEEYQFCWDESLQEPIPFDVYVNEILIPGSKNNLELRSQRKFYLQHFIDYLREQDHPLYQIVLHDYETALRILNTSNRMIYPSFYSLLDYLDHKAFSYSIILRSFGEEICDVKNEITIIHKMSFNQTGQFREGRLFLEEDEPIEDPYEIYNHLRRIEHTAIHDDWHYWNAQEMSAKYGKPFYVNREDNHTLSIFFDDNIREDDSIKNIIAPLDVATGKSIPIEELIESGQAVRVETLKAILNSDYYIYHIEKAIDKYQTMNQPKKEAL